MAICQCKARIPTKTSTFNVFYYYQQEQQKTHLAITHGPFISSSLISTTEDKQLHNNPEFDSPVAVRIHSSCFTSETLGSTRCDCSEQLNSALEYISLNSGIVIYLSQEGRDIGLLEKLKAYNLIDMGHDTLSANIALGHDPDPRDYTVAAEILKDLSVSRINLLTNNPHKISAMQQNGIIVENRLPILPENWAISQSNSPSSTNSDDTLNTWQERDDYLLTKIKKMGHLLG